MSGEEVLELESCSKLVPAEKWLLFQPTLDPARLSALPCCPVLMGVKLRCPVGIELVPCLFGCSVSGPWGAALAPSSLYKRSGMQHLGILLAPQPPASGLLAPPMGASQMPCDCTLPTVGLVLWAAAGLCIVVL